MDENITPESEMPKEEQKTASEETKAEPNSAEKDVLDNKIWALLSYLGVLVLLPLLGKKESDFAQFHARQGLVLLIGWVVSWFPIFGWAIGIIVFVLSIIGIINVLNGEKKKLPIVGDLAEKIKL